MKEKLLRLNSILSKDKIDYVIVSSPENIYYISGLSPNQLTVSRNPNYSALVYQVSNSKITLSTMDYESICFEKQNNNIHLKPYPTWVGLKTKEEINQNINNKNLDTNLIKIIKESINSSNGKVTIGIELDFITMNFFNELKTIFPDAEFINVSPYFINARSIKSKEEIDKFIEITEVCDNALLEMSKHIKVGITEKELIKHYRGFIFKDGRFLPSSWTMLGFGTNSACLSRPTNKTLKNTHSIRFDGGANAEFDFYTTDFSRSWLMPDADPLLKKIKPILFNAQRKMINSIHPGMRFKELFQIGYNSVKSEIPNYTRGHLGHSISIGPQTAEMPFINASNDTIIEEGMILCIEVPLYITNLGGFNIEDMILVTNNSCKILTYRTPHFLEFEEF